MIMTSPPQSVHPYLSEKNLPVVSRILEGGTERPANTVQTTRFLGPKKSVRGDGVDGGMVLLANVGGVSAEDFPEAETPYRFQAPKLR